jgi:hypothetical protein
VGIQPIGFAGIPLFPSEEFEVFIPLSFYPATLRTADPPLSLSAYQSISQDKAIQRLLEQFLIPSAGFFSRLPLLSFVLFSTYQL